MHAPTPTPQHDWLRRLVGEWTSSTSATDGPGGATHTMSGRETVRALGDVWVICEAEMHMSDGDAHRSVMTLGFDTAKNKFVGTFIASMMTMIWHYEGTLDADGRTLSLNSSGPSMMPGADPSVFVPYVDAITIVSDDERVMTSTTPGPDGKPVTFMTMIYRRVR